MPTDEDVKKLVMAIAPFMAEAAQQKRSMVQIELDPAKVFGIAVQQEGAGRIYFAAAAGPSIEVLKSAVSAAQSTKH